MSKKFALYSKGLTGKTRSGLLRLIDALHKRGITIYLNIMEPNGNSFADDQRVIPFADYSELPDDIC